MKNRIADEKMIIELLDKKDLSFYRISKDTKVHATTLSRIANGDMPMERVTFGTAHKLTEYAEKLASENKRDHCV